MFPGEGRGGRKRVGVALLSELVMVQYYVGCNSHPKVTNFCSFFNNQHANNCEDNSTAYLVCSQK